MKFKNQLQWIFCLFCFTTEICAQKQIALTFDDAPRPSTSLSSQQRTDGLLQALQSSGVEQVMFFVTTKHLNAETKPILNQYAEAGHLIGNHSDQHQWLQQTQLAVYQQDFLKTHEHIKSYKTFKPMFRFPYLDEGRDQLKSQGMMEFLKTHHYQNAYVTVDNYDWYLDKLYQDALKTKQNVNLLQLKKLYVEVLWQAIAFSDQIAMQYLGRSPKHILLLHDNDLAALFVDDLVDHLRAQGWEIISPLEAYHDPIAKQEPKTLFKGQGRVAALARDAGANPRDLVHVAEDEEQLAKMFKEYQVISEPSQAMPEWFKQEMQNQVGTWQASNAEFQSEAEPFSAYRIEWTWGLGQQSVNGRLFAIHNDQPTGNFWTFKQYWDPAQGQARLIQMGHGGRIGDGFIHPVNEQQLETIQTFSAPGVDAYSERHLNHMTDQGLVTTSFKLDAYGDWQPQRSYLWVKQTPAE
ncbi:polysaccharide deacetylase family protein [Marinicella litoralis]|uniref:Polysaccharide deacetylase n=1 Tax=Marinicella litoralis TaxID=644220 RepID=A0A4R6XCB2_9GAMM|nr:polysaccharide deacetylase family protein [Marinicella litoralis]TDR16856.1 polysaccharide deacetylase [Marinicella litoralis]